MLTDGLIKSLSYKVFKESFKKLQINLIRHFCSGEVNKK